MSDDTPAPGEAGIDYIRLAAEALRIDVPSLRQAEHARAVVAALEAQGFAVVDREDFAAAVRSYAYTVSRTAHPLEDHARVDRLRAALAAPPVGAGEERRMEGQTNARHLEECSR